MGRPRAVSVNSPTSFLWKSSWNQDDSVSSEFSKSGSEAGCIYAYSSQTLLKKAKSLKKTKGLISDASLCTKSQDTKDSSNVSSEISWSRAKSTIVPPTSTTPLLGGKGGAKPKVMKYITDLSKLFDSLVLVPISFDCPENIAFYKGVHDLDGFTYIVKKIRIVMKNNEDIKEHPSYKEILKVKDNSLPVDIHYVNSWVELSTNAPENSDEVAVELCIQMRYVSQRVKLVKDLLIWTKGTNKSFDEDTLYDMAEDICDQCTSNGQIAEAIAKLGCSDTVNRILLEPATTEEQTWNICYKDLIIS